MDIRIVFPDESMSTLSDINDLSIMTGDGKVIPLSSVAEITMENVPSSISRDDQSRYVTISCDVYGRDSGSIGNDIQAIIDQMTIPDGYSVKLGGANEMMNDTFSSLGLVIVLAIVLVYMVMAAQFESFVNPFIINVYHSFGIYRGNFPAVHYRRTSEHDGVDWLSGASRYRCKQWYCVD